MPPTVLNALEHVLRADVRAVPVVEYSIYARLHGGMAATTRPDLILLAGSGDEFISMPALVLHEYFHVVQQWNTGHLTRSRYLLECFRHGYHRNPFEIEARSFSSQSVECFNKALGWQRADCHPVRGAQDARGAPE